MRKMIIVVWWEYHKVQVTCDKIPWQVKGDVTKELCGNLGSKKGNLEVKYKCSKCTEERISKLKKIPGWQL